jgi:hypothetical protein
MSHPLPSVIRRQCLVLAAVGLGLWGCASAYPKLAGRYATDEITAAGELAPMGGIAYRLCRQQAAYAFLVRAQNADVQPPAWPRFYGEEAGPDTPAASLRPISWSQTCDESAKAAQVVHTVCRGLRAHGRALASLANGQPLDTSAIESATNLVVKQMAGMTTNSGVGKVAQQAGSAFASTAQTFLDAYRRRKLEQVVTETCMDSTFEDLLSLHDAMLNALIDVEHRRAFVVRSMARAPLPPRGDRALSLGEAMDAVGETDHALRTTHDALSAYKIAITRLMTAYRSLAKLADAKDPGKPEDVTGALDDLESSLQDLTELER